MAAVHNVIVLLNVQESRPPAETWKFADVMRYDSVDDPAQPSGYECLHFGRATCPSLASCKIVNERYINELGREKKIFLLCSPTKAWLLDNIQAEAKFGACSCVTRATCSAKAIRNSIRKYCKWDGTLNNGKCVFNPNE